MAPRSKRVSITEPMPGEALLEGDEVTVELSEDDIDSITIEAAPQESEVVTPEPPAEPNPDDAVRRAVEAQQRAEENARNLQRERDEALRRERERNEELAREREGRQDSEYNGILTALAAEQAILERAEAEMANLLQAGEYQAAAKAQSVISKATARIDRLEDNKATFDQKREAAKTEPERKPEATPQALTVDQQIDGMKVPDTAKTWLRSRPELVSDPAKLDRLGVVHRYLTQMKSIAEFTPEYFDAMETELGIKKPAPAASAPAAPAPQKRTMPVAAPVSRDVPTPSGQRQSPTSITLSPEQVRVAHTAFTDPTGKMTNADKEREYAKNLMKLQRARANGSYPSREEA